MRTRTRSIVKGQVTIAAFSGVATTYRNCANDVIAKTTSSGAATVDSIVVDESITDELGKSSSHPVTHRRRSLYASTVCPGPLLHQDATAGYLTTPAMAPRWPIYSKAYTNGSTLTGWDVTNRLGSIPAKWTIGSMDPSLELSLKENVLRAARGLKADVMLDLVEGSQLWPAIKALAVYLPKLAVNWRDARKLIKSSSNAYLAYKFGLGPVLSDVIKVHRHLGKLRSDIQRHVDGDKQRFSQVAELPCYCSTSPEVSSAYGQTAASSWVVGRALRPPTVRYVLVVKPWGEMVSPFFKKADRVLSRFGTSPASLAWELYPFSFVYDWFADIRGTLRALDSALGFSPYDIVSFTRSYSYHLSSHCSYTVHNTCNGSLLTSMDGGEVEFEHYERRLVSSSPSWVIWKPRYGENQAGITAALIGQRLSLVDPSRHVSVIMRALAKKYR